MKLAAKFVSIMVLGVGSILVIDGYVSFRRQRDQFEADMAQDIRVLGLTTGRLVADIWQVAGRDQAWRVIEDANKAEPSVEVRWVMLDAPPGHGFAPRAPRDKMGPVALGQNVSYVERDSRGQRYFYSYFPVAVDGQPLAALEIREPFSTVDGLARRALIKVVVLTGFLVLVSGCATVVLGFTMIGRPLDQIVGKIRRIGTGDFSGPLLSSGHDELGELAVGLNTMCTQLEEAQARMRRETEARIAALEQLRHEDRLKTPGRMASSIAHELGTPLNVISGYAGMIAGENLSSQETTESARTIKMQSDRITNIVQRILAFARPRSDRRSTVDLQQLVDQTVVMMTPLAQKQNVRLVPVAGSEAVAVKADGEQIRQVLLNLITNAVQAMHRGGTVEVGIGAASAPPPGAQTDPAGSYVGIWVQDEGEGISQENLSRIFDPFFTTKEPGKGTGLGLSIAEGIVREHGGWIAVESTVGKGSRFCVCLPRQKEGQTCRDGS